MARTPISNELYSYTVPNLIQGVSQQAPEQRRDAQCEAQWDCVNSPINGCEARPPFEVLTVIPGARWTNAWFRQIARGNDEHYVAVVSTDTDPGDKTLRVFDLTSGEECAVTETASMDYLHSFSAPRDNLRAATLEDYTFIANRETKPAIGTETAPNAWNEALFYFRAGGYSVVFKLAVYFGGNVYTYTYTTPDNSTSANGGYIGTNQLAATFYKVFVGVPPTQVSSGDTIDPTAHATTFVGPAVYDSSVGTPGAHPLTSLGFYVAINASTILIGRNDDLPFRVDATDGVGDTYVVAIKDEVQSFSDLPSTAFTGFSVKVAGTNKETADDYYVTYSSAQGQAGAWAESVKPGTPLGFDADTMPHALVSTGYQQFEFIQPPWGQRVAGDGEDSSVDPSFVGKRIEDIGYSFRRLQILTEGASVWSKARNPFVFFPSSAQTTLATDPVDVNVGGGSEIALCRKIVQVGDANFLWAEQAQFRVTSGSDPFKQGSVEAPQTTNYEFSATSDPLPLGSSLYFIAEPGDYSMVRELLVRDGKPAGDATAITDHVQNYVPGGVALHTASEVLRHMYLVSLRRRNEIYVYDWLIGDDNTRLQSAWNIWRLPETCQVVWAKVRRHRLHLIVQRDDAVIIGHIDLRANLADPDQTDYQTRVDMKVPEGMLQMSYDPDTELTTIVLPYMVPEAHGYQYVDDKSPNNCPMFVATRITSEVSERGQNWTIQSIQHDPTFGVDTITVRGDCSNEALYVGFRISARRDESQQFYRDQQGAVAVERLQVVNVIYTYSRSGYFRVESVQRLANTEAPTRVTEMTGRTFGDPANTMGAYPIVGGTLKAPINLPSTDIARLSVINDSFLPSRLIRMTVQYHVAQSATPRGTTSR